MRMLCFATLLVAVSASAQVTVEFTPITGTEKAEQKEHPNAPRNVPHKNCCGPIVVDANGKVVGEVIKYDERFQSIPLNAWVRYEVKGGDAVAINVGPEQISGPISGGGSNIVFTSNDCSGDAFVPFPNPPLTKRYAVILQVGGTNPGPWAATNAWLYVTDPLPVRVNAGATVFHSQWDSNFQCTPYPAPGLTFQGNTWGFWTHKSEDLYAKYKRPFYVP